MTDAELDRLASLLEEVGAPMNLEMVDGFYAALICAPELVPISEYLPEVLGEALSGGAATQELMTLLIRYWSSIAIGLANSLGDDPERLQMPLMYEDDAGVALGNDWASGFMRGVQLRAGDWQELIHSDEYGGPLFPILLLAHEHDPDPALRPRPITSDERANLILMAAAAMAKAYRHFAPQRQALAQSYEAARAPLIRAVPKVGRNEPCPCGSGRKYKHCCLAGAAPIQ